MTIKEAEEYTGLTKKAIYYYEQQGLIQTKRLANGYREYDEEILKKLLMIKKLRMLDFSVSQVENYFDEEQRKHVLIQKIQEKEKEFSKLQKSNQILEQLLAGKELKEIDVEKYFLEEKKQETKSALRMNMRLGIMSSILFIGINMLTIILRTMGEMREMPGWILMVQCGMTGVYCYYQSNRNGAIKKTGKFVRTIPLWEKVSFLILAALTYIVAANGAMKHFDSMIRMIKLGEYIDYVWAAICFMAGFLYLVLELGLLGLSFIHSSPKESEYKL